MSSSQNQRSRGHSDALAGLREAVADLDSQAFADCFRADGWVRVPRPEGDVVLRGPDEIEQFGAELRDLLVALSWTPSQRFVAAGQVVEEAVARARTVPGVGWGPPGGTPDGDLRVPMRVVAALHPDGEIGSLTVWVDWAALRDPLGVESARGAASALVAQARARDDRGLRVIESEPGSAPLPLPPVVPVPRTPGPPRPSASALWWKQHRATLAGSAMALAAAGVIGWVAVIALRPILDDRLGATAASPRASASVLGAETRTGTSEGNGGTGTGTGTGGTAAGTGGGTGATPSAPASTGRPTASKLPVIVREQPQGKPTVQAGQPYVLQADILFETGKADLTPAARAELLKMAGIIRSARVTGTIQVNGYTDDVGTTAYNLGLSQARSLAVAQGLRRELRGVQLELRPQGFGEPQNPVTTPAARRQNRKVVIVLPDPK